MVPASLPIVTAVSASRILPRGVIFVSFEGLDAAELGGAVLDAATLTEQNGGFARPPAAFSDAFENVVAVRVPPLQSAGLVPLRLLGPDGPGDAVSVEVLQDVVGVSIPPPSGTIEFVPDGLAPGTAFAFPAGTDSSRSWTGPLVGASNWWYTIQAMSSDCAGSGELAGTEYWFPVAPASYEEFLALREEDELLGDGALIIRSGVTGTIELTASENRVEITVTRAGVAEPYVGGYVSGEGGPPVGGPESRLVLTSETTGFQLNIDHNLSNFPFACPQPEEDGL